MVHLIGNFVNLQYCSYVAGLVIIGLSQLFTATGMEDRLVSEDTASQSNAMGLFFQKTNIIRDYLEDVGQGRQFWPKKVNYLMVILVCSILRV